MSGPVGVSVPRDRDGPFDPKFVKKRQKRQKRQKCVTGADETVNSRATKGLTTREAPAHLGEMYGAKVSRQAIPTITDKGHGRHDRVAEPSLLNPADEVQGRRHTPLSQAPETMHSARDL
ncbi:Transposase [Streptomyces sp. MP131-18]|nr:Transposase [Streptomyces sp. MP131-18]